MDLDSKSEYDRTQRAASVLSGMSMEDMEAAETLNSLQKSERLHNFGRNHTNSELEYSSPQQADAPPIHVHTQTSFDENQPEPLLRLFTSQYPLAGSLINGSLSAYKTTQSYIPGAEWTERNVGLPIAGKVARISGVEGGLRYMLQPRRDGKNASTPVRTPDVEKGLETSQVEFAESLPAYNAGDRSPPYSESQLAVRERKQPPPGWRQQLVISTSGLGVAMSEESLRSLRFCLGWLRWANGRLGEAIHNIKTLLERWNDGNPDGASPGAITQHDSQRQAAMSARIEALKKDVLDTLKHVVGIVSDYAGGALPANARELVHRHLTSLPQRFNRANSEVSNSDASGGEAAQSANRVMVLAQEGLDMMTQVSRVVNDTLVSAEGWCEKFGRKTGREGSQQQLTAPPLDEKKEGIPDASLSHNEDVKMEM